MRQLSGGKVRYSDLLPQEFEARLTILKALQAMPPGQQKRCRAALGDLHRRMGLGNSTLSQAELSLDWPGYTALLYRTAEELSGVTANAKWEEPPK